MYTEQQDLLQSQTNADEKNTNKSLSSELYDRKKIDNTPFTLIKDYQKKEQHITIGNYRINKEPLKLEQNIEDYLQSNIYDIMLSIAIVTHLQINKN